MKIFRLKILNYFVTPAKVFSIIDIKYIKYLWECIDFNYEQKQLILKNYSNQKLEIFIHLL